MEKYKLSQFNSIIAVTDKIDVAYNAYSNRFMLLHKGVMKGRLEDMADKKELVENLIEGGFVIDKSINEVELVKELSQKVDSNNENFNLIINPTLNCNFKCWYCYETKKNKQLMSVDTLQNVKRFIQNTVPLYPSFHLSFFGGEPLLGYKKVVKPLMEYTSTVCKAHDTKLIVSFTSNGYLITYDMVHFFKGNSVENFQITLDGNKELHNQTRYQRKGNDSYSRIVDNIKQLLEQGISVTLRFNYTDKNVNSLKDVADDIENLNPSQKDLLYISFHQVWQNADVDIKKDIEEVIEYFTSKGFKASTPIFDNVKHSCYADKKNNALINYNGDVFKCTAVDFENTQRDGYLNDNGTVIWENDSLNVRLNSKFRNKPCLKCRLLPICNGACTQKALDYQNRDYCILSYDEKKKDRVVLDKFASYINSIK